MCLSKENILYMNPLGFKGATLIITFFFLVQSIIFLFINHITNQNIYVVCKTLILIELTVSKKIVYLHTRNK